MREYNLVTTIAIKPLTQTRAYDTGSSSFYAMSLLNLVSTTSAYLLSMPSTEKKKLRKFFPLSVEGLTAFIFIFLLPSSQEPLH